MILIINYFHLETPSEMIERVLNMRLATTLLKMKLSREG